MIPKTIPYSFQKLFFSHSTVGRWSRTFSTKKRKQSVLVMGCNGSLGSAIVSQLRQEKVGGEETFIVGADISPVRDTMSACDVFVRLEKNSSPEQICANLFHGIRDVAPEKDSMLKFQAVICANGGFAMDEDSASEDLMDMNYNPIEAVTSDDFLPLISSKDGLLVAMGAAVARHESGDHSHSFMTKYISSKKKVHDRIQRLGIISGKSLRPSKRLEDIAKRKQYDCLHELTAVAILPSILDTKNNRKLLKPSDEELQGWTNVDDVVMEILKWMRMTDLRPTSGSLIKCVTEKGVTDFVVSR